MYRLRRIRPRGLGFSYYDLLNQAGMEDCDPKDSACTMRNSERQTAVEDLWVSQYESNPNTANQPVPQITVTPDNSPAALNRYMSDQPETTETISTSGGSPVSAGQLERSYYYPPATPVVIPPSNPVNLVPVYKTPAPPAQGAPPLAPPAQTPPLTSTLTLPDFGGLSFSSIPWWGWAAGAGALFLAFGRGRG